jgi:hypothetical protein
MSQIFPFFIYKSSTFIGAAWLSMVRRGSVWCGVAQWWCGVAHYGAAWLSMVRRCSDMVRRGSVMVRRGSVLVRRLAVRQARVRFWARHHREVFPHWSPVQWGNGERPRRMEMDECMVSWYHGIIVWMWFGMHVLKKTKKISVANPLLFYEKFIFCFICISLNTKHR